MDKAQAIHSFWSGFGWPAIDELSSYDIKTMEALGITDKYITYEVVTGNLSDAPVAMTASLWHKSMSWAEITQKADEIAAAIGYGGRTLKVDEGYIQIWLGSPFAQRMAVDADYDMRRIYLNIQAEFLTAT